MTVTGPIRYDGGLIEIRGLKPGSRVLLGSVDVIDQDIRMALVEIGSPFVQAKLSVEMLTTDVSRLADRLDQTYREPPRAERFEWATIANELSLAVAHDGLGHLALSATLHGRPWEPRESSATATVHLEVGQLPRLAAEIRRLFHVPGN